MSFISINLFMLSVIVIVLIFFVAIFYFFVLLSKYCSFNLTARFISFAGTLSTFFMKPWVAITNVTFLSVLSQKARSLICCPAYFVRNSHMSFCSFLYIFVSLVCLGSLMLLCFFV